MISLYEAVAQNLVPPVQATGAVVPQVKPQQQTKPNQVPAQSTDAAQQQTQPTASAAQQPSAIAGQDSKTANLAAEQQTSDQNTQSEPSWKKPLKIAAAIGAGIGGGALLHDIYHNGGLSNWAHNRFGDINFPSTASFGGFFGNGETETAENDETNTVAIGKARRISQNAASRSGGDILSSPKTAPYDGPVSTPHYTGHHPSTTLWPKAGVGSRGAIMTDSLTGRSYHYDPRNSYARRFGAYAKIY